MSYLGNKFTRQGINFKAAKPTLFYEAISSPEEMLADKFYAIKLEYLLGQC